MNIKLLLVLLLAGILVGCNNELSGNTKRTSHDRIRETCLNGVIYYYHIGGGIHAAYDIKHKLIACK